jgi:hypothetical protein
MKDDKNFVIQDGVLIKYKGREREVTVPLGVYELGRNVFSWNTFVQKIILPDSVSLINPRAFSYSTSLEEIILPPFLEIIMVNAFDNCTSLKRIVFPDSLQEIGAIAFHCCLSLKEVKFPPSLKFLKDYAFDGCENLSSIEFCTDTLIYSGAFTDCPKLSRIKLDKSLFQNDVEWFSERFDKEALPIIAFENFDKNAPLTKHVLENTIESFKHLIQKGRTDLLKKLFDFSDKIEVDILDRMLEIATEQKNPEAVTLVIEYKSTHYTIEQLENSKKK